jgi:general secretion pathway protein G
MLKKYRKSERGMTLVELLVVIVIIGLMMAVLSKGLFAQKDKAQAQLNQTAMNKLQEVIEQYRLEFNTYPSALEDLVRPSGEVQQSGKPFFPLTAADALKDVWGNPFIYRAENNNRSYSLTSLGSDGIEGGDGAKQDITLRP